ncbi:hypothetical protein BDW69DRAFT_188054 [Aspergillus filifer]
MPSARIVEWHALLAWKAGYGTPWGARSGVHISGLSDDRGLRRFHRPEPWIFEKVRTIIPEPGQKVGDVRRKTCPVLLGPVFLAVNWLIKALAKGAITHKQNPYAPSCQEIHALNIKYRHQKPELTNYINTIVHAWVFWSSVYLLLIPYSYSTHLAQTFNKPPRPAPVAQPSQDAPKHILNTENILNTEYTPLNPVQASAPPTRAPLASVAPPNVQSLDGVGHNDRTALACVKLPS